DAPGERRGGRASRTGVRGIRGERRPLHRRGGARRRRARRRQAARDGHTGRGIPRARAGGAEVPATAGAGGAAAGGPAGHRRGGRFGEWLENNVDWALSRDRYWGTPLNVWECETEREHREVIGSYAELAERVGAPLPKGFDPHKPHIDQYTWSCRQCGGAMRRVPEVIDAWFD